MREIAEVRYRGYGRLMKECHTFLTKEGAEAVMAQDPHGGCDYVARKSDEACSGCFWSKDETKPWFVYESGVVNDLRHPLGCPEQRARNADIVQRVLDGATLGAAGKSVDRSIWPAGLSVERVRQVVGKFAWLARPDLFDRGATGSLADIRQHKEELLHELREIQGGRGGWLDAARAKQDAAKSEQQAHKEAEMTKAESIRDYHARRISNVRKWVACLDSICSSDPVGAA